MNILRWAIVSLFLILSLNSTTGFSNEPNRNSSRNQTFQSGRYLYLQSPQLQCKTGSCVYVGIWDSTENKWFPNGGQYHLLPQPNIPYAPIATPDVRVELERLKKLYDSPNATLPEPESLLLSYSQNPVTWIGEVVEGRSALPEFLAVFEQSRLSANFIVPETGEPFKKALVTAFLTPSDRLGIKKANQENALSMRWYHSQEVDASSLYLKKVSQSDGSMGLVAKRICDETYGCGRPVRSKFGEIDSMYYFSWQTALPIQIQGVPPYDEPSPVLPNYPPGYYPPYPN
jgi:hypothetical protein